MKRLLKLTAFLSLWALFFGLVAMIHLWVSVLGMPNRWKIITRVNRIFTLLLRSIQYQSHRCRRRGAAGARGYVIIANHVGYIDGIVLAAFSPSSSCRKKSAVGRLSASGTFCAGRFSSIGSVGTGGSAAGDDAQVDAGSQYFAISRGHID
jgi:1-acyl-sn-glycerol-3-phosphate acyltransferase